MQLSLRYSNSEESRKTYLGRAQRICAGLGLDGYVSWNEMPSDSLPEWCNRDVSGHFGKPQRAPAKKTVSDKRSAARATVQAAFDAGLMSETQRDQLLNALVRRQPTTNAAGPSGNATRNPVILKGPLASRSQVTEAELQQVIDTIRATYRNQPGALADRERRARVFMRWAFGHIVSSWDEFRDTFDADLVTRYWEGRITPAVGIRQPSRESPTAANSRRRGVAAAMDAFVELGHLEPDHEAVLAAHPDRRGRLAPDAADSQSIESAVAAWHPKGWSKDELRMLPKILPTVRTWVLAAQPTSVKSARVFMSTVAEHTLFIYRRDDTLDSEHVLHPDNINYRIQKKLQGFARSTVRTIRSRLLHVGRIVAPLVSPSPLPPLKTSDGQQIYSDAEQDAFRQAAELDWPTNPAARMFLVGVTCGAGLKGTEAELLGPGDIHPVDGRRLMVQVTGPNPRLVPIRAAYTDLVRKAVESADGQRFIPSAVYGTASNPARQITVQGVGALSLPRARATWIADLLRADVSLRVLRKICGPLHKDTLDRLLEQVAGDMDAQEAVLKGLSA
ncbi:hypothetical protein [Candidatus Poriferisodalis sp.]|uniref:hypothetical protein n=1 Tax=Candidatus Poriferisodalis sp. TaxID=3101277 RepID=UPI003B01A7C3